MTRVRDHWFFGGVVGILLSIIWIVCTEVLRALFSSSLAWRIGYLVMLIVSFPCALLGKIVSESTGHYAPLLLGFYAGFVFMSFLYGLLIMFIFKSIAKRISRKGSASELKACDIFSDEHAVADLE